jgi:hypothetical protein
MMKSAEDWPRCDLTISVNRPMGRRILAQGQMRSEFVVIVGVAGKDPAQMGLTDDDDVIVFSPGICWSGLRENRSGSFVQTLQMYS